MREENPFRIGVMESLTGAGEIYGTVNVLAKWMAADEINSTGGINGRMIELVIEDSKCSAQDAITAYNKLTDVDGVKIILGTTCSGAMLGTAPLAEADGVVLFSASATNPDIAEAGDYIFRTAMSDAQLGVDIGNVLWADGIRKLATINELTDYAEGVRRASVAQFEKRGGEVVMAEQYTSNTTNFITHLTKLLNANPDAIYLAAQGEFSGGTIVKQLRELGYDGPIYSEVVPIGSEALNIAGDAATGLKAITAELDPSNNKALNVLTNFRARYGYAALAWYIGSAYDDMYITAECLKKTGDDQDADGFRDCLYDITWSGAIGNNYSFDEKGEVVGVNNVVVEVLPTAERTEDNNGYRVLGSALTNRPEPTRVPPTPVPILPSGTEVPVPILPSGTEVVELSIMNFQHADATVKAGTVVIWTNNDRPLHTVTHINPGGNRLFDSKTIASNAGFRFQFTEPGIYEYQCLIHPVNMKATITVTE